MNYAINKKQRIVNNWSKEQIRSKEHWIALLIFTATTYLAFYNIAALIGGYVIFFLVTAVPRIYKMIIFFAITTIITAIFPPIGIILTIIFFILRIG